MADIKCPYCDADQDINHDDGYGYSEDHLHQQECFSCYMTFAYSTRIRFSYEAHKAPCLNGEEHDWQHTCTFPKEHTRMVCKTCDDERPMSEEERTLFLNEAEVSQ